MNEKERKLNTFAKTIYDTNYNFSAINIEVPDLKAYLKNYPTLLQRIENISKKLDY
ncbi:hypothetical protein [Companilactobacillus sp. DQM5]|uniref:hypothetical protein n=1 Tax=Companilactobacillus sp. DQM5 TaxID=3463359 RepID=UPI004057D4D1